jgi:hypothetical protein
MVRASWPEAPWPPATTSFGTVIRVPSLTAEKSCPGLDESWFNRNPV